MNNFKHDSYAPSLLQICVVAVELFNSSSNDNCKWSSKGRRSKCNLSGGNLRTGLSIGNTVNKFYDFINSAFRKKTEKLCFHSTILNKSCLCLVNTLINIDVFCIRKCAYLKSNERKS